MIGSGVLEHDATLRIDLQQVVAEQAAELVVVNLAVSQQALGRLQVRNLRVDLPSPLGTARGVGLSGSLLGCVAAARSRPDTATFS